MMTSGDIGWFWQRLRDNAEHEALWTSDHAYSYRELCAEQERWELALDAQGVAPGARVAIVGEFTLPSIALFLALIRRQTIIVPMADDDASVIEGRLAIVGVDTVVDFRAGGEIRRLENMTPVEHPLIEACLAAGTAGIVMFTSGSTGRSKAVLYRADHLIAKHARPARKTHRTLLFLKFDHIGGLNTLFAALSAGGTIIVSRSRQPATICQLIQAARVTLLPTTPSFLTMLVLSKFHESHDLSSLEVITYGTEVMPQSTLIAIARLLPGVKLKQTYGLTELGILPTQSPSNDSKWLKLGGEGVQWKVVAGVLWIRTATPMLGYLNAPSPFDQEGWYNTDDQVEVDGDAIKFLGRRSEIINVGGEKVYPQEVEEVLLEMPNVSDVLIRGVSNPVTGQTVCAEVVLSAPEDLREFRRRLRTFCQDKLARYKIPTQVRLSDERFIGQRLKKYRLAEVAS
jgi:acyl-CoA synthetase (AMP-forming)/AMP-acid ligase II